MAFEILVFVAQILLIIALFTYSFRSTARGISAYTEVPFVPTPRKMLPIIAEALDIRDGDVVYDLGCGDGRLLFYCAKRYPGASFIGLERNFLLLIYMRIYKWLTRAKNVSLREENVLNADFSDATRIYAFLLPVMMKKLSPKLRAPIVASRAFVIPDRQEKRILELSKTPEKWNKHLLYIYAE